MTISLQTQPDEATQPALSLSPFAPARIVQVELSRPLPALSAVVPQRAQPYQRALVYVSLHTQPLGVVELVFSSQEMSAEECAQRIWEQLGVQINEHLREDGLSPVTRLNAEGLTPSAQPACELEREHFLRTAPFVSVIVPTHDRPADLSFCLPTLLALRYPRYELLIVDNAPSNTATEELVQRYAVHDSRLRYIREDRPGVSWARNAGIAAAQGAILAFTDDDVKVDPNWLLELVRGFDALENVGCVTGQVQPLELETPAQYWCEENAGLYWFQPHNDPDKRFIRRIFRRSRRHVHLYRVGLFGCGASMAFRAEVLRQIQGFDPAMGGTGPSRCGQDIAAFFQALMLGYHIVYEPAALVQHLHRRTFEALRKQIYNYGVGLTAYLTRNILRHPQLLLDLVSKVPYDLFVARPAIINEKTSQYPKTLRRVNLKGMLYGPFAYLLSRRLAQRVQAKWGQRTQK